MGDRPSSSGPDALCKMTVGILQGYEHKDTEMKNGCEEMKNNYSQTKVRP